MSAQPHRFGTGDATGDHRPRCPHTDVSAYDHGGIACADCGQPFASWDAVAEAWGLTPAPNVYRAAANAAPSVVAEHGIYLPPSHPLAQPGVLVERTTFAPIDCTTPQPQDSPQPQEGYDATTR